MAGFDPNVSGHILVGLNDTRPAGSASNDYIDSIVDWLREMGVKGLPSFGKDGAFVEEWRRWAGLESQMLLLKQAWIRVEAEGKEAERRWLNGRTTQDDWVKLMYDLVAWEKAKEKAKQD